MECYIRVQNTVEYTNGLYIKDGRYIVRYYYWSTPRRVETKLSRSFDIDDKSIYHKLNTIKIV